MGLHTKTIKKIEDSDLCTAILRALQLNYSHRYIQQNYGVTRRELERIIQYHTGQMADAISVHQGPYDGSKCKLTKGLYNERNSKNSQSDLSTRAG